MKIRTLVELLTLSTNLYSISKDEELMHKLSEMAERGKQKAGEIRDKIVAEAEDEESLLHKLMEKAAQAREELEHKMEEVAVNVYAKMKIAHTNELEKLQEEVEALKRELALAEARLVNLEQSHG